MKTADAVAFYGSKTNLGKALGITPNAISQWGEYVPLGRDAQIQLLTKGKLKARPPHLAKAS